MLCLINLLNLVINMGRWNRNRSLNSQSQLKGLIRVMEKRKNILKLNLCLDQNLKIRKTIVDNN